MAQGEGLGAKGQPWSEFINKINIQIDSGQDFYQPPMGFVKDPLGLGLSFKGSES